MNSTLGYKKSDMQAAMAMMDIHVAKLKKALSLENYSDACSALRAIEDECINASRISAGLSLNPHLQTNRFPQRSHS